MVLLNRIFNTPLRLERVKPKNKTFIVREYYCLCDLCRFFFSFFFDDVEMYFLGYFIF